MLLALLALALIAVVLAAPMIVRETARRRGARAGPPRRREALDLPLYDPGRERRAEQRARELLRSCVNAEEWAMYRDLGFIRVGGKHTRRDADRSGRGPAYAYLIYAHKPIVAFVPRQRAAAERVLRRVPRHDRERRAPPPAGVGRRARQVDGAHLGRGPRDPAAPTCTWSAASSTPRASAATSGGSPSGSAAASGGARFRHSE